MRLGKGDYEYEVQKPIARVKVMHSSAVSLGLFTELFADCRPTKEDKEIKPKKKAGASTEELCAQTEELLTSLNFADLGPVPPWSTEDADPENGGLTEFHIQVHAILSAHTYFISLRC